MKTEYTDFHGERRPVAYRQLIIKLRSGERVPTPAEAAGLLERLIGRGNYRTINSIDDRGVCVVELQTKEGLSDVINRIGRDASVVFVEPNDITETCPVTVPNDPLRTEQWYLQQIDALAAWQFNTGSPKVLIAVADSGLPIQSGNLSHEDLDDDQRFLLGADFTGTGPTPADDNGHGSHVIGIAAARARNAKGIVGLAHTCTTLSLKVFTANGVGPVSWVYNAAKEANSVARGKGMKLVFNYSGGSRSPNQVWNEMVEVLRGVGAVLCAAAGNDASSVRYPAALSRSYDNILAVGATDETDRLASFSNRGPEINVVAPGVGILSTLPDYPVNNLPLNYGSINGTSMAAPLVSALAAIVWTQYGFMSAARICRRLEQTAVDLGQPGRDNLYGFGRINAKSALESAPLEPGEPIPQPQPWPNAPQPPFMCSVVLAEIPNVGKGIAMAEWFVRRGKPLDAKKELLGVLAICNTNSVFTRIDALNTAIQSPTLQHVGAAYADLEQQTTQEKLYKAPWLRIDALFHTGYRLTDAEWFTQYNSDILPVITRLESVREAAAKALIYGDKFHLVHDLIQQVIAVNDHLKAVLLIREVAETLSKELICLTGVIDRRSGARK
jgi:subtilisin family serine protease